MPPQQAQPLFYLDVYVWGVYVFECVGLYIDIGCLPCSCSTLLIEAESQLNPGLVDLMSAEGSFLQEPYF